MGLEISRYVGAKSSYVETKEPEEEIDFKDPLHETKTKQELYDLFLSGKLVHIQVVEDLQKEHKTFLRETERGARGRATPPN